MVGVERAVAFCFLCGLSSSAVVKSRGCERGRCRASELGWESSVPMVPAFLGPGAERAMVSGGPAGEAQPVSTSIGAVPAPVSSFLVLELEPASLSAMMLPKGQVLALLVPGPGGELVPPFVLLGLSLREFERVVRVKLLLGSVMGLVLALRSVWVLLLGMLVGLRSV